ncbi:MAG: hypothetical protein CR988_02800 [Treponema sp.]|nr:MAG: hypothetical protein CR988_02800 [Treponema sp.]
MKHKRVKVILLFFFLVINLNAEFFTSSEWGYSLDLPEGFALFENKEDSRFLLKNNVANVELQIFLDSDDSLKNTARISKKIFKQLNAEHKDIDFLWCGKPAMLSTLSFHSGNYGGVRRIYSGWLLILKLDRGWITLVTYVPELKSKEFEPMMISILDSVFTGGQSYYSPGPVTSALYPKTGSIKVKQKFNGRDISFFYDKSDMEANQSVVDREFQLLTMYIGTDMAIEAWKRYYRNIYRDAWRRLESLSFSLKAFLSLGESISDSFSIASKLLTHLQNFTYLRNPAGSDFINLPECYIKSTGDCDARSVLMCVILQQMGIDCVLAVSPEFSHAMAAINCKGTGAVFSYSGKKYLVAETTAKIKLGQIASDLADPSKWFITEFYGLPVNDK